MADITLLGRCVTRTLEGRAIGEGRPRSEGAATGSPGASYLGSARRPAPHLGVASSFVHRLTKAQARRIAVRAQLLDAPRPTDLLQVVQRLTLLQIDPTAAIAPSADLVAWSRLGSAYRPARLTQALEEDRTLFEHNALIRPMGDLGLVLAGASD